MGMDEVSGHTGSRTLAEVQRADFTNWEMKSAQAAGGKVRWGSVGFFESRMWMALWAAAISTQFELSPL
ncbi:hypothetical protein GCM10010510_61500 [Streptomyces anandii JCM 4720]|nr:hypothetical protein GCM10010510_61500 [Streptomyces anandii JCM 4720]